MPLNPHSSANPLQDIVDQLRDLRGQAAVALSDLNMLLDELARLPVESTPREKSRDESHGSHYQ